MTCFMRAAARLEPAARATVPALVPAFLRDLTPAFGHAASAAPDWVDADEPWVCSNSVALSEPCVGDGADSAFEDSW